MNWFRKSIAALKAWIRLEPNPISELSAKVDEGFNQLFGCALLIVILGGFAFGAWLLFDFFYELLVPEPAKQWLSRNGPLVGISSALFWFALRTSQEVDHLRRKVEGLEHQIAKFYEFPHKIGEKWREDRPFGEDEYE